MSDTIYFGGNEEIIPFSQSVPVLEKKMKSFQMFRTIKLLKKILKKQVL